MWSSRISDAPARSQRGVALIATLALLTIASIMLVSFVTMMQLDRSATYSYGQSLAAEGVGMGGLRLVVNELTREMAGYGAADTAGGTYRSKPVFTNVTAANFLPQPVGTNTAMTNLVKISTNAAFSTGSLLSASTLSSTVKSQNQRSVKRARWDKAYLGTFPADGNVPYWVFVTRGGPTNARSLSFGPTGNTLNNPAVSNPNYAIGRFAYAVYDVGGLLDINAAGYPPSLTTAQVALIKSSLAGADLTVAGLGIDTQKLIAWRNAQSGLSAASYLHYVTNTAATNGFQRVAPGDTAFLCRQDLIQAARLGQAGLNTAALPHLTVFSREKNAPAWGPATNAPTSGYDYQAQANAASATNRFLPNVRFGSDRTLTGYHDDGTSFTYTVSAGDPVPSRRFSLARLAWIGRNGPQNGGTTAAIQVCFGLVWDNTEKLWKYYGPTGSSVQNSIKTPAQVAAAGREPDFFELLQAGILAGSLGRDNQGYQSGSNGAAGFPNSAFQRNRFTHLLAIGANIVDQYDNDSYPTLIRGVDDSGTETVIAGSESLPCLDSYRELAGASPDDASKLAMYLTAALWNPSATAVASTDVPQVRLRFQGAYSQEYGWGKGASSVANYAYRSGTIDTSILISTSAFSTLSTRQPLLDSMINGALPSDWGRLPTIYSGQSVGFRFPDAEIDTSPARVTMLLAVPTANQSRAYSLVNTFGASNKPFVATMEFLAPSGQWVPYNFSTGTDNPVTWRQGTVHYVFGSKILPTATPVGAPLSWSSNQHKYGPYRFKIDPRSSRFSEHQGDASGVDCMNQPLTKANAASTFQLIPLLFSSSWTGLWVSPASLAFNNDTAQIDSYADIDGIRRIADSGLFTNNDWLNSPYENTGNARPIVLNRPFWSVAELGKVFRDLPWKSLDFFTDKSADAGLLELFSLTEQPAVRAGVLNVNTADKTVLTAVLATVTNSATLVTDLLSASAATRLISRADLARLGATAFGGIGSKFKRDREAPLRVLADLGQSRTWNLMIDLVAQAGKYPPNAATLDQFIVEGERRYWLHIALDRYTGEIVDQKLEVVYDF